MTLEEKVKAGLVGVKKRRGRTNGLSKAAGLADLEKLPPIPYNMKEEIAEARERHRLRPAAVGAQIYSDPDRPEGWFIDSPYRDLDTWEVMICETLGTRSHSVMWTFLHQLAGLCEQTYRWNKDGTNGRWVPDELQLNFILNLLNSEKPDTPLQAASLAHIAANHMLQMRIAGDALGSGWVDPNKALLVAKLGNASANMTDSYLKLRGRVPKQEMTITYERHVHLHHHKHAHVHATPTGEGGEEIFGRPHEPIEHPIPIAGRNPAGQLARISALPCQDPPGVVVPLPGREGSEPMHTPRRAQSRGSTR